MSLRNVDILPPHYTLSQPIKPLFKFSSSWKSHTSYNFTFHFIRTWNLVSYPKWKT